MKATPKIERLELRDYEKGYVARFKIDRATKLEIRDCSSTYSDGVPRTGITVSFYCEERLLTPNHYYSRLRGDVGWTAEGDNWLSLAEAVIRYEMPVEPLIDLLLEEAHPLVVAALSAALGGTL